ncbi:uncharacterized protein HMF8227_01555 [Saliniradius amylolyticus]|uniref:Large ribosomal RNA subunit accumulation protein YceD n=1 Tax=Saliniradius amylolyticus TaxID=2183582 RepID=A0A2S2E358_9ALTE|nr:23S rRNA accumulation protein YceD [Saliniradius amylolyticus]AWL12029.1 uncharacterized protein HMF8227_01555 [Saliniradius amylolyticus]
MQKVKLPKQLDPFKNAVKRSDYDGVLEVKDMSRLHEAAAAVEDDVSVNVRFDKDAQGLAFFDGTLTTKVSLICQRCNESFVYPVSVSFCFCPIRSDSDLDELPERYEPVEVDDHGNVDLLKLFEDELILSLPLVALHAEQDCQIRSDEMSYGEVEPVDDNPNPFAVLKELKRDQE